MQGHLGKIKRRGGPRVVCPYTALHPLAEQALAKYEGIDYRQIRPQDTTAYSNIFAEYWHAGEAFVIIEHDIEIHSRVLSSFKSCPEPWCVFAYNGPGYGGAGGGDPAISWGLGCVRFSKELLAAEPGLPGYIGAIDDAPSMTRGDWRRLDARLLGALRDKGYTQHVHSPPVLQHHVYHGLCACGREHDPYPVDREGRYCPT